MNDSIFIFQWEEIARKGQEDFKERLGRQMRTWEFFLLFISKCGCVLKKRYHLRSPPEEKFMLGFNTKICSLVF